MLLLLFSTIISFTIAIIHIYHIALKERTVARMLSTLLTDKFSLLLYIQLLIHFVVLFGSLLLYVGCPKMTASEKKKLRNRIIVTALIKITFLLFIPQKQSTDLYIYATWFAVICMLKLIVGIVRDQLESFNYHILGFRFSIRVVSLLAFSLISDLWLSFSLFRWVENSSKTSIFFLGFESLDLFLLILHSTLKFIFLKLFPSTNHLEFKLMVVDLIMMIFVLLLYFTNIIITIYVHGKISVAETLIILQFCSSLSKIYPRIEFLTLYLSIPTLSANQISNNTSNCNHGHNHNHNHNHNQSNNNNNLAFETCMVCKSPLIKNIKRLPCSHMMHEDCFAQWSRESPTCPYCKKPISIGASAAIRQRNRQIVARNRGETDRPSISWIRIHNNYENNSSNRNSNTNNSNLNNNHIRLVANIRL
ncbi:e3 ubiquitin-protein ligase amfr [Anaeramoeba flamelloides]|uniref:E3 ubiquitin-protein ligase amfr n=1 Tax=Anaeramoeba flamelloides TaxID=1746091 RepID=A0ABQ8YER8_9EUKA|nr:e3 ubiquitin-protein ligase amfr [Anaeramoeba flamelloides]